MSRTLASYLVAAACVYACLPDKDELAHLRSKRNARTSHSRHVKRDVVPYPPVLTETESMLVNSFDNNSISDWSLYYSSGYRLAGHNRSQAEWTQQKWIENGWESWIDEYWIWYTEPIESTLTLNRADGSAHEVQRLEDALEVDAQTNNPNEQPAYHALSGSGKVNAEYVYVGRGSREDYQKLKDLGVELEGKIALAQYGGANRGVKIKNAEDGEITEANGYLPYPGSTRWGSLSFGDPSTIGYASTKDAPRRDITPYGPKIPSIPISPRDGLQLLHALDGHGLSAETVNRTNYKGAFSNVTYHSGPAPGATLNLVNIMDARLEPAWDVIASINGTNPDEYVIIGNHRDGWTGGGAADAVSGGSLLVEMAKAFGKLVEKGWKPRRTIILASWDAEEFGLMGSTEWVEDHLPELIEKTVAYINLDTAVSGPRAEIVGSGEIQTIAIETMKKVIFPEGYGAGPTLYDAWFNATEGVLPAMGSGSDYAAFYHNGISSVRIHLPLANSLYDTHHWMTNYADPGFHLHAAMGQFVTLLTYHIADDPLIPWDMPHAGSALRDIFEDLEEKLEDRFSEYTVDLSPLDDAVSAFEAACKHIDTLAKQAVALNDNVLLGVVNTKFRQFSRGFASAGLLPGRFSFYNVVSAPGLDSGYGADVFPAIQDSLDQGNLTQAEEWVERSAKAVLRAAEILKVAV
ncbi:hypothetical protein FGSG_08141 [Fusarium graminearum PH-1]|uniref:hypothetical protein n=1 Tax=Gibberella zeae (strain ATCC MYA-4620 / CBS 123657 / FGSC 9075 / NRRL 31084 / PH-1) TaxID=229533 RepID=UPI00021F192D|nr:hypothetical protein FGSG_08141 [Fusarium graminearum PH-1]ESU15248.1 hypothetical protein FGSG_08141 [Fusarium graminearum PH-1]|eukprot:XP_011320673.1 hypothetical protein FGSG_08141 [Fusarium graminearum PH-1]